MRIRLLTLTAIVVLCCTSYAFSLGQRRRGEAVFSTSGCAHCHSIRHSGGHKGPDLSGVGRRLNAVQMRLQIINGSKLMPPFGEDLRDSDIADLLSYLHSCREKEKK